MGMEYMGWEGMYILDGLGRQSGGCVVLSISGLGTSDIYGGNERAYLEDLVDGLPGVLVERKGWS